MRGRTLNILVFGAGVLGTHHIMSLASIKDPVSLVVIDPRESARNAILELLSNTNFFARSKCLVVGSLESSFEYYPVFDVAIVACNARDRFECLQSALSTGVQNIVLEKILFTQLCHYDMAEASINQSGAKVYVNCVRRSYRSFRKIHQIFSPQPFNYRVEGAGWGLASNLVHHLDEFCALAGTTNISIDASGLEPGYIKSKRASYIELCGRVRATASTGSTFEAECTRAIVGYRTVTIKSAVACAVIEQNKGSLSLDFKGRHSVIDAGIPLQSEITRRHVLDIVEGRQPQLAHFPEASHLHRVLLEEFLKHLRQTCPEEVFEECPIT